MNQRPSADDLNQISEAIDEVMQAVEQLPLADLLLLVRATKNTTTIGEIGPEYTRLKEEHNP